ncbi:Mur ligase family protein [Acetivibrio saccincola]|uniref:Glutamate ligase n=1 Tax=Acetivibrio saccincola TaxID=1677857 RepID=A0A2K9EL82_9FIRM|nr:Mur ligase family protein [Acetivibrio saccincola]AUG57341.1 putative bifunctional UDP-N-acetylmuramoylalanyl-D-glutamate--2,6-diaminopimelate ligase/UDP-N-acetylmuramoyl-tripeptide:D-alanyl-D-alanine ligase [Acetivibrio saccincola]NLW28106.1 glutamate ligase [Acetivibrio saccincola]PQQ67273.1 glutamate ligase [Acetivibrio saccincola]
MLIAGIIGQNNKDKISRLIHRIFSNSNKRISIVDSKNLSNFDAKRIKDYFNELEKNNVDIAILKIDFKDLLKEIFYNIKFDVIIFTDKADEIDEDKIETYRKIMKKTFSLLNENGVAIVNSDDNDLSSFLSGIKHYIVTYGFNLKASITTSSVGDFMDKDDIMCCLQRTIHTKNGKILEPQEFKIKADLNGMDLYNVLAAATFALINGVDVNLINN